MLLLLPLLTVTEPALLVSMSAGLAPTVNVCVGSVTLFLKAPPTPRPNPSNVPTSDTPEHRSTTMMNAIKQPSHGLPRLRGATAGPA